MRVLIAEDDDALASFVRKGSEAEHYAVDVATDGEQARAMATQFDYDLLPLDLILPRADGIAILRDLTAGGKERSQRHLRRIPLDKSRKRS